MAMRRRFGAVYEDFQPKLEATETPEAHLVKIHLPGFTRDQIKVRYVTSLRSMSVTGERSEGGNKWIRFSEAYPVPENCELNRISGQFDQGILTITMPKKFVTPFLPKEEQKTSEDTTTSLEEPKDSSLDDVYEDFQPKTEMTEDIEAYFLLVYLPGFTKEQVGIKYVSPSRMICIHGERPIEGGKRWSRVDQQYPAPENFNEEKLVAKFDQGILTITMPKKHTAPVKEELKTSEDTTTNLEEPKDSSLDAVYEEFQAKMEMIENLDAYLLQVHLPEFTKDQVRIKYVSSSRMISISGERPIEGGKKWIRVNQQYPAPENSNEERLAAKFDQGILTIRLPKKFPSPATPKEEFKTSQDRVPSPPREAMAEPKPHRVEEVIPPKLITSSLEELEKDTLSSTRGPLYTQEPLRESKPQKGPEEIVQKPFDVVYEEPRSETTENPEAYHLKVHLPGFKKDQVKIKYISSSRVMSVSGERPYESYEGGKRLIRVDQLYPVPENCDAERVRGKFDLGILTITMPKKFVPQLVAPKEELKTTLEKSPSPLEKHVADEPRPVEKPHVLLPPKPMSLSRLEHAAPEATEASFEGKRIEDIVGIIGKGIEEVAASASSAVTSIGEGVLNDEEKHLLAMVIAALGAYVSYRISTSGKPYN